MGPCSERISALLEETPEPFLSPCARTEERPCGDPERRWPAVYKPGSESAGTLTLDLQLPEPRDTGCLGCPASGILWQRPPEQTDTAKVWPTHGFGNEREGRRTWGSGTLVNGSSGKAGAEGVLNGTRGLTAGRITEPSLGDLDGLRAGRLLRKECRPPRLEGGDRRQGRAAAPSGNELLPYSQVRRLRLHEVQAVR